MFPRNLEKPLLEEAARSGESPSMYLQELLRERVERSQNRFSDAFVALAGSWEDDRTAEEIVRDIEDSRESASRSVLRQPRRGLSPGDQRLHPSAAPH